MSRTVFTTMTIVFVLFYHIGLGQDTVRVFFDFGKSQLTRETKSTLESIPSQYDVYAADSIAFIGYADSVGKFDANIKLSLKRAKNVRKFMKSSLDEDMPISIYARGEDVRKTDVFARRVSVVLYYTEEEKPSQDALDVPTDVDPKCFKIAMYALAYCNVTTIKKRRKKYARLEAEKTPIIEETDYYYMKEYRDGRKEAKRVRWKETKTGKLWWKRKRLVAEIPYKSYDKSNFFTLDTGDCVTCNIGNLIDEDTAIHYVERTIADAFLMENIQVKRRWLKRSVYKIKAPAEYIDVNKTYYSSHRWDFCSFFDLEPIEWEKKRGRRRKEMYFADVKTTDHELPYITTTVTMMECHDRICNWSRYWGGCGGRVCGNFFGNLVPTIGVQTGVVHQNDSLMGYLGMRLGASNENMNYGIDLAVNTQIGWFANAMADYKIVYFGRRYAGWKGKWIPPLRIRPQFRSRQYLYTGLATKMSTNRTQLSYIETNAHVGWGLETYGKPMFNRFFIEAGIARDWTRLSNTGFYPFIHAGIRWSFSLRKSPKYLQVRPVC